MVFYPAMCTWLNGASLLFDCYQSKEIWDYVTRNLEKQFYYEDIVLGTNIDWVYNTIVSLIVYIIYSERCKLSFENKERQKTHIISRFTGKIRYWQNVYKEMNIQPVVKKLKMILAD